MHNQLTALHPQPTRWPAGRTVCRQAGPGGRDMWLHINLLRTHAELLAQYDDVGGTWHERIVHVEPLTPRVKDRYLQSRAREQTQ